MPLHAADTIIDGKYRILELIGEGGMARVWLAEEPKFSNRRVAIKEPKREALTTEDLVEQERRFHQEVEVAAMLDQARVPHVIRALTLEELPDGTPLLVMEYAEGGSLAERIAQHPDGMPIEEAVQITLDICEALQAFHDLPTMPVHRDVKPSNILFDAGGRAYLADFGLCELPGRSGRSKMQGKPHPATPLYAAPEQLESPQSLTPAADIFALGCVLFEMLTGKPYRRVEPGTQPRDLREEVPAWLDEVTTKALVHNPWHRWQDTTEFMDALETREAGIAIIPSEQPQHMTVEEKQDTQLDAWYAEASRQVEQEPERALKLIAQIRNAKPDYPNLTQLEDQAKASLDEKNRREKVRQERQRLKQRADEALTAEQWEDALNLADQLEELGERGTQWAGELREQAEAGQKAKEEAERARRGWLSPWNPFHWLVFLWWLLFKPARFRSYKEPLDSEGAQQLQETSFWLASTLGWLPLLLGILWIHPHLNDLSLTVDSEFVKSLYDYWAWLGGAILLLWLLSGSMGQLLSILIRWLARPRSTWSEDASSERWWSAIILSLMSFPASTIMITGAGIVVVGIVDAMNSNIMGIIPVGLALTVAFGVGFWTAVGSVLGAAFNLGLRGSVGLPIGIFFGTALVVTLWWESGLARLETLNTASLLVTTCGTSVVVGITGLGVAIGVVRGIETSVAEGRASWFARGALGALVISYAVLIQELVSAWGR